VGGGGAAPEGNPKAAAQALLADALTDDARARARSLPPEVGGPEALVLLQAARRLNPQSPEMLHLLALAASASKDNATAIDALKALARLDPGNLVAQVDFLDLLAQNRPVDEQLRLFQSALAKNSFDPQVRSELAVRAGRLLVKRGENDEARKYFTLALQLNDVNVGAWQEIVAQLVKAGAPPTERIDALTRLLWANPYQPEAIVAGAQTLANSGVHNGAANWYVAALEQSRLAGLQAPPEVFLDLGVELICAGRYAEAESLLTDLLKIDNGPTQVPMLAYLVAQHRGAATSAPARPAADAAAASQPASPEDLVSVMRKRAAAAVAADPKSVGALAEALWVEYCFAPAPADDAQARLDKLKELAGATDPLYQRMVGWSLLAQKKYEEARTALAPLAAKDPLAGLGLARLAAAQKDTPGAQAALTNAWALNPSGIAAALLSAEARKQSVTLADTALAKAVGEVAKKYPESMLGIHRQPRDLLLLQPKRLKSNYAVGEPIFLDVDMVNATDHALYAGPGGAVSSSIALGGNVQGVDPTPLGVFAVDNSPRIFRLDSRATLTMRLPVDQGLLRDLLYINPSRLFSIGLMIITSPRAEGGGVVPGLGGQRVSARGFNRDGFPLGGADGIAKICSDLRSMPLEKQMVYSAVLQAIVYNIPEDTSTGDAGVPAAATAPADTAPATEAATASAPASAPAAVAPPRRAPAGRTRKPSLVSLAEARRETIEALVNQLKAGDPLVQAWMLRYAPPKDLPTPVIEALDALSASPDTTVRMFWYTRQLLRVGNDYEARAKVAPLLRAKAAAETDPLAKRWAELLAIEAELKPRMSSDKPTGG
jgi:tetratricopeptide (TPR) repeat protein